jgi:hypothetical protein
MEAVGGARRAEGKIRRGGIEHQAIDRRNVKVGFGDVLEDSFVHSSTLATYLQPSRP